MLEIQEKEKKFKFQQEWGLYYFYPTLEDKEETWHLKVQLNVNEGVVPRDA